MAHVSNKKKFFLLILVAFGVLVFFFYQKEYQKKFSYLSGDEPHYIMMTDSLAKDGDFNLKNDYELGRSKSYYPGPSLSPQLSPLVDKKSAEWYPIHTIGLPLVSLIPYKAFGVIGVRILMIALQFSAVIIFYLILSKYLKSKDRQILGMILLLVCALFWQNLGAIFPDLLLVTCWGAMILLFGRQGKVSNLLLALIFVLGALIHGKGLVLMAPLFFFNVLWLININGAKRWLQKYWLSVALVVMGFAASTYFLYAHYGIFSPSQLYGKDGQLFSANPVVNLVAMLTDRSKGILVYFPVLIVSGPYLYRAAKDISRIFRDFLKKKKLSENHFLLMGVATGLALLLITVLGFDDWSGSTAPNGRNILAFLGALIFLIAKYSDLKNILEMFILGAAGALSALLTWFSIVDFQYYMSTGVNSFWVDRFQPLVHLPLFQLTATEHGRMAFVRGTKILILILALNLALIVIYKSKFKLTIQKRNKT